MTIITYKDKELDDCAAYFHWLFSKEGLFEHPETERRNQTLIETYRYKDKSRQTKIIVSYEDNYDKLIYYNIISPLTPGYTMFWESDIQYFEQGQYDNPPKHGEPGLEFNQLNIKSIDKELKIGLAKRELQYYKNGKLIKSKVEFNDEWNWDPYVARFEKRGCLFSIFRNRENDKEFDIRTVEIENIFE